MGIGISCTVPVGRVVRRCSAPRPVHEGIAMVCVRGSEYVNLG